MTNKEQPYIYVTRLLNILGILLIVNTEILFGQNHGESLKQKLDQAFDNITSNPVLARRLAVDGLEIANRQNARPEIALAYNCLGLLTRNDGDFEAALENFQRAKKIREELGLELGVANIKRNMGAMYRMMDEYATSIELLSQAIEVYTANHDTIMLFESYIEVANTYEKEGDFSKSIIFSNKSLSLSILVNDEVNIAKAKYLLGTNYLNIGKLDSSEIFLEESQSIFKQNSLNTEANRASAALGWLYAEMGNFQGAANIYEEQLKAQDSLKSDDYINDQFKNRVNYGDLLNRMGRPKEALSQLNEAQRIISDQLGPSDAILLYTCKAIAFGSLKQPDSIFHYWQLVNSAKDSLYSQNKIKSQLNSEVKYKSKRLERDLNQTLLKSDKQTREIGILKGILITTPLILFAIIAFFVQKRRKDATIAKQKMEIKDQSITHLIQTNELNTRIAQLKGQDAERERIAQDLHDGVGGDLLTLKLHLKSLVPKTSQSTSDSIALLDSVYNAIRTLSHDLKSSILAQFGLQNALQALFNRIRESSNIKVYTYFNGLEIWDRDELVEYNIYKIAQELVANTLKHAEANSIEFQMEYDNDTIRITYGDDGIGAVKEQLMAGLGITNINDRIISLGGIYELETSPGKGFTTFINIPINMKNEQVN